MMNKLLIVLTTMGLAIVAKAQVIQKLTLQESIQIASDSSLQSFRVNNLYQASFWEYRAFRAARLPSLTLNMTPVEYNREFIRRYEPDSNIDVYRIQQSLYSSANVAVNQNLDMTGGTFFIDSEFGFFRNMGQTAFTQYSSVPIRIGYVQSLTGFNPFRWEKKIEPLKYEKAKKQYLYSREEVSESVIEHFFTLALAQAEYEMAIDNVKSADTLFHIGQERFKIAAISQADMLTLKLDAINANNSLKNIEIELKKATFNFRSFLNLEEGIQFEIVLPQRPKDLSIPIDRALDYAQANNPDYLGNRQEIMEAEREADKASKEAAFNADLWLSTGFNQVAGTVSGAYRDPLQQNIVRIGLSVPILDWGVRKGRVNMAKNNLNVARISVQQKELSLEQDVMVTVSDFNIQQDMINSAEEALDLAVAAYNATRQRFIIGKSDINSLTLSLNRQKEAQKNYISVLKNYWLSYYRIRKLTLYDFERQAPLSFLFDKMNNVR